MHSITEFEGNIPAFLAKLWNMVEEPSLDDLIAWGANGLSFVIKDQNRFAKELLPMYYKHNNMASFIRQLNMYGFHKNLSLESGCAKMEEVIIEFYHPCFQKNNPNLLQNIKRKINSGRGGGGSVASAGGGNQPGAAVVNQVLHDVRKMKSRQNEVDSRLAQMKMENEALWREVAMLRQKHIKQQQIVNKLIQFLVSFVQHPHGNGISVKRRNIPLMLQDRSTHSNTLNKNNQSLSGISEITRSPTGPVIHEIDPNEYAASLLLNDVRGVDASSPQDPTASQETGIDNDETGGASDPADDNSEIVATDELLDLPDQLLADAALPATSADRLTTADGSQLFARPNQIRASKRRPRKPAATKKLSQLDAGNFKVADESCPTDQQSDVITGLVLDDFPLIIPGSQALEQLSSLPTTADDVTALSPQTVSIEAVTSPIAANLTADSPIAANLTANSPGVANLTADSPGVANLTADSPGVVNLTADSPGIANLTADSPIPIITATSPYSADLTAFAEVLPIDPATIVSSTIDNSPVTIVNSTPTIVNSTVPIVAPQKKGRYKKIVPKLSIPEPKSRTVEKSQVKVIRPQRKRRSSAQSSSSSSSSSRSGGDKRSKAAQKDGGAQAPPPPPPAAPENSDRTVACMSPSNSQQSIKYARNQEFNNSFFKPQEIDNHVDSMQNDLETLKELLKGESISLDANTLLGLFNAEDPFSLTMDLPTTMPTEDKSKEPDNNQLVSYSWGGGAPVPPPSSQQQDLGDLFGGDYQDWLLGGGGSGEGEGVGGVATSLAEDDDDDLYGMADLNTPDVLVTPDSTPTPTLTPGVAAKKKRK